MYMADADWVDVPLEGLLNKQYALNRSELMSDRALSYVDPGIPPGYIGETTEYNNEFGNEESYDTTHISVADKYGNLVSCTSTIEATFGNGMVVRNRGFLLNNELNDFSIVGPNQAQGGKKPRRTALGTDNTSLGGKRPRSSMSPIIILKDKKPIYALGSPGGWTIINHVVQVILNLIDFDMNIDDAVFSPRFTTRNEGIWYMEDPFLNNTGLLPNLKEMGFENITIVYQGAYSSGCVNVVKISDLYLYNKVSSAADFRRMGSSASF